MCKITTTITINADTSNPINVDCVIAGEKHAFNIWDWEIEKVKSVELVIGDKEGIDITKTLTSRALALITAQAASEDDQIIDALEGNADENVLIDEQIARRVYE
jgi:hypothetical protein